MLRYRSLVALVFVALMLATACGGTAAPAGPLVAKLPAAEVTEDALKNGAIFELEQGAGVAGSQSSLFHECLNLGWKPEEPHDVGYGGAVLAGATGDLFLGQGELRGQPLKSPPLFQRAKFFPLNVFY